MRFKLTKELCYFSGMTLSSHEPERSRLGFRTTYDQLAEQFIKTALALGVDSRKMIVEKQEDYTHIYFFHSKLARMSREVLEKRESLPKRNLEMALWMVAGIFDSSGHVSNGKVFFRRLDKKDALMLALLGIHTTGSGRVMNSRHFLEMIKAQSFMAKAFLA
jgi:hypothetical protein